jgi:hypothetical protein
VEPGREAYVELKFSPSAELITTVRRFVSNFYQRLLKNGEASSRLALATHELLENAVKFSMDGESTIRIGVLREERAHLVTIRTCNRATREDIATLQHLVEETNGVEDHFQHYQTVMRRSTKERDRSRLGLARICAEAQMSLACQIVGEEVYVVASTQLDVEHPGP